MKLLRRLSCLVIASSLLAAGACDSKQEGDTSPGEELAEALDRAEERFPQHRKRRIVLLGFDACDPDLVEDLVRKGKLPNFARLRREGASGTLRSIQPLLSPVVWTSIATGMTPERHGILDFFTEQSGTKVPVSSRMRQADTMWELLARNGEKVGVVGWLVTFPADELPNDSFVVTDRMGQLAFEYGKERAAADTKMLTYPPELAKALESERVYPEDLTVGKVRPFADVTEQEFADAYIKVHHPTNLLGNLRLTLATAETFRNTGLRMLREERPRFFACYFEAMDALSHYFMRYAPPKMKDIDEELYDRYRTAITANYIWHDRVLGEFMELCDEDTTLIVVSDHGFKSGSFRMPDASDFHAKTGAMWHRIYGVVYAWGNGVAKGKTLRGAHIYDIAPTVLASMGYPVPKEMRGRVLADAFEDGLEYESVDTYYAESRRAMLAEEFAEGDPLRVAMSREEWEKLSSLGYTGGDRSDPATTGLNLGNLMMSSGRVREALEQFQGVLEQNPTPRAHMMCAEALLMLGRLDEAESHMNEASKISREPWLTLSARTRLSLMRKDHENALITARQLQESKPFLPTSHVLVSTVLETLAYHTEKAGDAQRADRYRSDAIVALQKSLDLEPKQFHALLRISRLRMERQERMRTAPPQRVVPLLERAKEELDRALELFPNSPKALNNSAIAHLRLGIAARNMGNVEASTDWMQQALGVVDQALEYFPRYPEANANRAYVFWQMGRLKDAHEAALETMEIDPSYELDAGLIHTLATAGMKVPKAKPRPERPKETGAVPENPGKSPTKTE